MHCKAAGWEKKAFKNQETANGTQRLKFSCPPELITKRNALIAGTNVHDERQEKAFEREQKNNGSSQGVHAIQFIVEYGPFIKAFELSEGILFT